jgi:hypothetical protein
VRLVRETGKPIAHVARDLGINESTLGNWVNADQRCRNGEEGQLSEDERAELLRLRRENAELTMERDVVKRSALIQEIQAGLPADEPPMPNHPVSANDAVSSHAAGPEHPGFLAAQSELAYSAGQAGDAAAARDQFAALLPAAERVLGPQHPDTLAARASLAYWTGRAGDAAAARDQFAALLPVAERVLGPEHPDILINRHNLANFTGYTGDAAAARDQFAALLRVRERLFGADSPGTLVARFNLACWTGCAGDAAAARDQFGALLLSYELVFGPEHAETLAVWHQLAHWTALAANDAAKQGIVTRSIRPQGVADADDEGDVVEEGEGDSEGA